MFSTMDQALPGDAPITLVIKAPNQRMEDQTVECMLGWTIRKLKQHLETVYPSKPKHNEQRLIYSGKLLQDHLTLKEILRQYEGSEDPTRHTVHLVCSASQEKSSASTSKLGVDQKTTVASPSPTSGSQPPPGASSGGQPAPPPQGLPQAQSAVPDGLRYRGPATTQAGPQGEASAFGMNPGMYFAQHPGAFSDYRAGFQGSAGYTPEQYAWMVQQQAYSQYMMQYMQYYQSMYYSGQQLNLQAEGAATYMQQPPVIQAETPQQQQQQQQQPAAVAPRPNNNAANNNMPRMNAQGGVEQEDDDDPEMRDWLHHFYSLTRCLTFLGILFFYSNLTRFLLVSGGTIAIYFLQKMRRHMQRMQQVQEQERARRQAQEQQQQQQQAEEVRPEAGNDGEGANSGGPQQQENGSGASNNSEEQHSDSTGPAEEQQQQPAEDEGHWITRAFVFVCVTVQAFFTSLLPTPPELLEAAN